MNLKELLEVSRNTIKEFGKDDIYLLAAGLTYYAFLSLFPLLLLGVTLAGLFLSPEDAAKLIFQGVAEVIPWAADFLYGAIAEVAASRSNAGLAALISIGVLAYS